MQVLACAAQKGSIIDNHTCNEIEISCEGSMDTKNTIFTTMSLLQEQYMYDRVQQFKKLI